MIANLKPYPAYKDSGVPWLGDVPEQWEMLPGRACLLEKEEPNLGLKEKTVLSLSFGRIVIKPKEALHGLVPESFETYQIVDPGDIVCRPTDLQNDKNSLRFGISQHRGIITSAYICLRTKSGLASAYGHLLLHSYDLMKVFYGLGSGLRQNLSWSDFKYLPSLVPPPDEQAAICRFLDYADRRVRRYIRAKERMIELLNEEKQAIIQRAVTRGLDPNVRLKPSGVDWLGDIPEYWEVLRSKYVYREIDNRSELGEETHLSMSQKYGLIPSSQLADRHFLSESYAGAKLCLKDDLVLNRLKAHLGVFALAPQDGVISPDYTVFRPRRAVDKDFFLMVYRTPACRVELRQRAKGVVEGLWRLYTDDFYDIPVPVPPPPEQESIVERVQTQAAHIEKTLRDAERVVELINEYRTRLIADVVTGKLDVREAAATLPDELDEERDDARYDAELGDELDEDLEMVAEEVEA